MAEGGRRLEVRSAAALASCPEGSHAVADEAEDDAAARRLEVFRSVAVALEDC
jgi:hypothetical protein